MLGRVIPNQEPADFFWYWENIEPTPQPVQPPGSTRACSQFGSGFSFNMLTGGCEVRPFQDDTSDLPFDFEEETFNTDPIIPQYDRTFPGQNGSTWRVVPNENYFPYQAPNPLGSGVRPILPSE